MQLYVSRRIHVLAQRLSNHQKRCNYIDEDMNWVHLESTDHLRLMWLYPTNITKVQIYRYYDKAPDLSGWSDIQFRASQLPEHFKKHVMINQYQFDGTSGTSNEVMDEIIKGLTTSNSWQVQRPHITDALTSVKRMAEDMLKGKA
jgi:hypothetical protein